MLGPLTIFQVWLMHKKHTLKVIYNFCIKKKQNMDGASFEAFSSEEENLEHFLEKSSGKLKYFLQKGGFLLEEPIVV